MIYYWVNLNDLILIYQYHYIPALKKESIVYKVWNLTPTWLLYQNKSAHSIDITRLN